MSEFKHVKALGLSVHEGIVDMRDVHYALKAFEEKLK